MPQTAVMAVPSPPFRRMRSCGIAGAGLGYLLPAPGLRLGDARSESFGVAACDFKAARLFLPLSRSPRLAISASSSLASARMQI
jgi:hypothetical protein